MKQPLSAFKDQLLQSEDIQKLIAEEFGPEADAAIGRFRSGDDGDLWNLIATPNKSGFKRINF